MFKQNIMRKIDGEKWKVLTFHKAANKKKYAISSHGRLVCFTKIPLDGNQLKGSLQGGYPIWRFKKIKRNGTIAYPGILIHRLVAENFLPTPQKDKNIVIHFNYNKKDNHFSNLAWATKYEVASHAQGSPGVKKARKKLNETGISGNSKLTLVKVKVIKSLLQKGKTLKEIATKYKVSDMQIHRIKTGENWGRVK